MNFENRTLFIADNLDIMRGMDSETIDLIYLDPPFKSGKQWKAPIGSPAEGAEFKDIWTDEDIKYEWHGQIAAEHEELYQIIQASEVVYDKSMRIYLTAMVVRLFEMHRILKPTGSIYLHCDPTASHYLKAFSKRRHSMKTILVLLILFSVSIALPIHAELTETDLENIRQILREELQAAFQDIHVTLDGTQATFDEIDTSFDSIHRNLDRIQMMLWIATVLVVVAGIVNWGYVLKLWCSR